MQEIRSNTTYFQPAVRNGWIIKFSVYKNAEILLMFVSKYTGQTIIRYFPEEDLAVKYINMIIAKDSTVIQDISEL
jgi:hypothetical protein